MCPALDPTTYQPRPGEPGMMTTVQREAACTAYYRELAEAGEGRLITFGDGSAWFVPNDIPAIAKDIATSLGKPTDSLAAFVIAEALRVVVDLAKAEMKGAPVETLAAIEAVAPPADPAPSSLEATLAALAGAIRSQGELLVKLANPVVPEPTPTPQPITGMWETMKARLEDGGYTHVDHNLPGVVRETRAFVNLYNGAQVHGKEPVIALATPQQCVEATVLGIHQYAEEAASKRLVWRLYPTLSAQDGGYVIRCRLLAMGVAA